MTKIKLFCIAVFWAASMAAMGYLVYFIFQFITITTLASMLLSGNDGESQFFGLKLALSGLMCAALFFVSVYKLIRTILKLANRNPERT